MQNFNYLSPTPTLYRIGVGTAAVMFMVGCASTNPPTDQLAVSKAAISSASSAGGSQFAPGSFKLSTEKMDAAERAMAEEDYPLARRLAEQAQVDAQLAAATARSAKAQKAARELQEGNRVLRQEIDRQAQ